MANTRLSSANEDPDILDAIFVVMERKNKNKETNKQKPNHLLATV